MIGLNFRQSIAACALAVSGLSASTAHAQLWTQATAAAPWTARSRPRAVAFDGRMWIMGGETNTEPWKNDVWSSVDGATWTQATATAPWPPRIDFVAMTFDGRMWIMGGYPPNPSGNDVWYSTNGVAWTRAAAAAAWPGRGHFTGVSSGGRMWILGSGPEQPQNDVWFSTDGASWTMATRAAAWPGRYGLSSTDFDGRLWMAGANTDVWYTTNGSSWTAATTATPWGGRGWLEFQTLAGKMWVFAGDSGTSDTWYSTDGTNWNAATTSAPWAARFLAASASHDGKLWLMAGYDGGRFNDVWFMTPCVAPTVTTPPASQTVCQGGAANLSVVAAGNAPLAYQWRKNGGNLADGGNISGATTSSLSINPAAPADAGNYNVIITNACGAATSAAVTLTVLGGADCNSNGRPDACDVYFGTSADCDTNTVPDECDTDCNQNSTPDACESASGSFTWTGADGGSFSAAGNWSPAGGPGSAGQAVFANATAVDNRAVLADPGVAEICSLAIGASGTGRQILQINAGSTLYAFSGATVSSGGEIDLHGGELAGGTVSNASNTLRGYGTISASVDNHGLVQGQLGHLLDLTGPSLTNHADGTLLASFASLLDVQCPAITQQGDIRIETLAGLHFTGPITNAAGASITLLGGSLGATTITNAASADLTGTGDIQSNVINNGSITAIADLQIFGNLANNGTITLQSGIMTVTGSLSGSGTIIGGFGGRDGDDSSPPAKGGLGGVLRICGDFDLASTTWTQLDLTSTTVQMNGPTGTEQTLEVLAPDLGPRNITLPNRSLFSIGALRIGPTATTVRLVNHYNNTPGAERESLYVNHLILDPGATLDLAGQRIYYGTIETSALDRHTSHQSHLSHSNSRPQVIDTIGGGSLTHLLRAPSVHSAAIERR